jgi:tetrahydromethanopterin S-methyltransferase subunit G
MKAIVLIAFLILLGTNLAKFTKQNKEVEAVKPEAVKPEAEKFPMSSEEVDRLNNRIKALSDELYEYIGSQIRQQASYTDENKEHLEKRIKGLSDELYEYIGEQIQRQKEFIIEKR